MWRWHNHFHWANGRRATCGSVPVCTGSHDLGRSPLNQEQGTVSVRDGSSSGSGYSWDGPGSASRVSVGEGLQHGESIRTQGEHRQHLCMHLSQS